MIRFTTDINWGEPGAFERWLHREDYTMRKFMIGLSAACVTWVSAALMLAIYSHEVALFIVERMQ